MGFDIKCLFPALGTMTGYAVTCTGRSTVPGPPGDRAGAVRLWEAVERSPKPCVVVLETIGPDRIRSCHYGDMMATPFQAPGSNRAGDGRGRSGRSDG